MKAKIKEGILLGIGMSIGMLLFQIAMMLLNVAAAVVLNLGSYLQG